MSRDHDEALARRPDEAECTWFEDIDHLRELNTEVGWTLDSFQIEAGSLSLGVRLQPLREGAAYFETTNRQVGTIGEPPDHGLTFGIPLHNVLYVNGVCVEPGSLSVLCPRTDTRVHTGTVDGKPQPRVLVLHLDGASVANAWRAGGDDGAPARPGARVLSDTRGRIQHYGLQATRASSREESDALASILAEELASLWTTEADRLEGGRALPRRHVVERVWNHGMRNLDRPVPLEELSRVAGVSPRTLRRAFIEEFGSGPAAVLRLQRLHRAKRSLLAEPNRTVQDVAHSCGFNHLGRFSLLFKEHFGRLPSSVRGPGQPSRAAGD